MASFSFWPALKLTALFAGISMTLPVAGLRPLRAARFLTDKLANPGSAIESLFANNSVNESSTACNAISASFLVRLALLLIKPTSSFFIHFSILIVFIRFEYIVFK